MANPLQTATRMPYLGGHYEQGESAPRAGESEEAAVNYWVNDRDMPYKDELFMRSIAIMIVKRHDVQTFEQIAKAAFEAVAAEENEQIVLDLMRSFDEQPLVCAADGKPLETFYTEHFRLAVATIARAAHTLFMCHLELILKLAHPARTMRVAHPQKTEGDTSHQLGRGFRNL